MKIERAKVQNMYVTTFKKNITFFVTFAIY